MKKLIKKTTLSSENVIRYFTGENISTPQGTNYMGWQLTCTIGCPSDAPEKPKK